MAFDIQSSESYQKYMELNNQYQHSLILKESDLDLKALKQELDQARYEYVEERDKYINPTCTLKIFPPISLLQVGSLIQKSHIDEFFVFSFDDTLMSRTGKLWRWGYIKYDPKDKSEYYPLPGFKEIVRSLTQVDAQLLIISDHEELPDLRSNLEGSKLTFNILETILPDGIYSKAEWLLTLIENNPKITRWNYIDHSLENLESIYNTLGKFCSGHLTINLYQTLGSADFDNYVSPKQQQENIQFFLSQIVELEL